MKFLILNHIVTFVGSMLFLVLAFTNQLYDEFIWFFLYLFVIYPFIYFLFSKIFANPDKILIVLNCIISLFLVYCIIIFAFGSQEDYILDSIFNFSINGVVPLATIVGAIFLLYSHILRYITSKSYGIPLKLTYASAWDNINGFLASIAFLVLGVGLPIIIVFGEGMFGIESEIFAFYLALMSFLLVVLVILIFEGISAYKSERKQISGMFSLIVLLKVILFVVYVLTFHSKPALSTFLIFVDMVLSAVLIIYNLYREAKYNASLAEKTSKYLVTKINDIQYRIVIRHSENSWILMPYILNKNEIQVYRGEYIIKSLDNLEITTLTDKKQILIKKKKFWT